LLFIYSQTAKTLLKFKRRSIIFYLDNKRKIAAAPKLHIKFRKDFFFILLRCLFF